MSGRPSGATWPHLIGGYAVQALLGTRATGPVYFARSLARGDLAALRRIRAETAGGPAALSWFARSAYAASLVPHPNLAAVRGLGPARGDLLVASAHIPGPTLDEQVAAGLPLEYRRVALLQTTRALQALHAAGLTHGNLRSANVRYDGQGLYRLLDVGQPRSPVSPDPATDPRPADVRAAALAERQAADRTALSALVREVAAHEGRLDPELARFASRLSGPEAYRDLGEAIRVLEAIVGVPGTVAAWPGSEPAARLVEAAGIVESAPSQRLRNQVLAGGAAVLVSLVALTLLLGRWLPAARLAALTVLIGLALFAASNLGQPGRLFRRLREAVGSLRPVDAGIAAFAALLSLVVLALVGELALVTLMAITALVVAVAVRIALDGPIERERAPGRAAASAILEDLRWRGLDEPSIAALAVAAHPSGPWLLSKAGLHTGRETRPQVARLGLRAAAASAQIERYALRALDRHVSRRREERLRDLFRQLEEHRIAASGVNELTARRRARRIATALVTLGHEARELSRNGAAPPRIGLELDEAVRNAETVLLDHEAGLIDDRRSRLVALLGAILGPRLRFLAGAALLAGFVVWFYQNELIPSEQLQDLAARAGAVHDLDAARELGETVQDTLTRIDTSRPTRPLELDFLPASVRTLFQGFGPGIAGAILLVSSFYRGARMSVFAIPAAAIVWLGPRLGVPALGPLSATATSLVLAMVLAALGLVLGRAKP